MTRDEYKAQCALRWSGEYLRDAMRNWRDFEDIKTDLKKCLMDFSRNPFQEDINGKCHNPDGTLTSFLWQLQTAWQPDRSCLHPFLDFEETFQKCFLRRGLIIYCKGLLNDKPAAVANPTPELNLTTDDTR